MVDWWRDEYKKKDQQYKLNGVWNQIETHVWIKIRET